MSSLPLGRVASRIGISAGLVSQDMVPACPSVVDRRAERVAQTGNLENGPPTGRQARVYADAGHCAFKYFSEWAPASFRWLAEHLAG